MTAACVCGRIAPGNEPTWENIVNEETLVKPLRRENHSAALLNSSIVIFGGQSNDDLDSNCLCVIWSYDVDDESWRQHLIPADQALPSPRNCPCVVEIDDAIYMHGGSFRVSGGLHAQYGELQCSDELWKLSMNKNGQFR